LFIVYLYLFVPNYKFYKPQLLTSNNGVLRNFNSVQGEIEIDWNLDIIALTFLSQIIGKNPPLRAPPMISRQPVFMKSSKNLNFEFYTISIKITPMYA
jgi:hypothetical protein